MINKVSERIVKPVEQQVVKASTYIEEKVMPKATSSVYSSPFALISNSAPVQEVVRPAGVGEILHFFG